MNRFFLICFAPLCTLVTMACSSPDEAPAESSAAVVSTPSGNEQVLADTLVRQVLTAKLLGTEASVDLDYAILDSTLGDTPNSDIAASVRTVQCTTGAVPNVCVLGIASGSADPSPGSAATQYELRVDVKRGTATAATMKHTSS